MKTPFFIIGISALMISCTASRFIEPIEKDSMAVGLNVGGPLIEYGSAAIPIPLSSLEVGYGLQDDLTLFGGVHLTSMFYGNAQVDLGGTYQLLDQNRWIPNVSVSPSVNMIWQVGTEKFKAWPILDVNAYWNYGEKQHYAYVGINNYFELSKTRALDQPQGSPIVFSPQIGHVLKGKNRKWEFITEIKFIAPYAKNTYSFVPYTGITGQYGATGIYLGYRYYFPIHRK